MDMEYKVGDMVKVRECLIVDTVYGNCIFRDGMKRFVGTTMFVKRIIDDRYYILSNDKDTTIRSSRDIWRWSDEMLVN
jgi:hypothetical protein